MWLVVKIKRREEKRRRGERGERNGLSSLPLLETINAGLQHWLVYIYTGEERKMCFESVRMHWTDSLTTG